MNKLQNIHPGEILEEEFLKPMKISQNQIARDIGVPPRRINEIIHGKRSVTADTSLRLSKYFGVSEAFFLNLQKIYDLEELKKEKGSAISKINLCSYLKLNNDFYKKEIINVRN
jgi:addiction module HigA family antidote